MLDPWTVFLTLSGVFVIAFMKGGFGGGFAIVGIPLLALAMDPLTAGAILAPLFVVMDLVALRYWKPDTWSKPDLVILLPGLIVGIALGTVLLSVLDGRAVAIAMALITLTFAALWFKGGGRIDPKPRSAPKAFAAGIGSGVTTMVAHSGGPPLAIYLLGLGLTKALYAGTTSIFFTAGNLIKVVPWLWVATPTREMLVLMLIALPAIPLGVWLGWRMHERLDQEQLYRLCYLLLVITAVKLLWDGASGYLA
ncbi:MAG: sulfite exporter TauE/SafE family protein [Thalassobaculaceae bacterium]|nr:sulfite exporter TauE/SafE family protein [Thalassobaculaceae bacterium]